MYDLDFRNIREHQITELVTVGFWDCGTKNDVYFERSTEILPYLDMQEETVTTITKHMKELWETYNSSAYTMGCRFGEFKNYRKERWVK